jgi:RNA polymerase sigma-70 factor, ECF subfamily
VDAAELIRQAQAGDEAALGALLAAHRDHLRHLADQGLPARLKARVDASDIVQQTCLSVFRQIAEFEGSDPAQFAAWLRQMHERNIQNAVRDQLRTRKRGDGREERLAGLDVDAPHQVTPSRHAMQREASVLLAQSLERLPEAEREVLRLRYLEGRTLVQISGDLDLSKDAVVWLMQKGMKRLRQWLPRNDGDSR